MGKPRLDGKVAIVTGAGSRLDDGIGNGRAAAILMAREAACVLLVDRRAEAAEVTREQIRTEGGAGEVFVADVTSVVDCRAMVAQAVSHWGRLDILDNNVGIGGDRGMVETIAEEAWNRVLRVNVTGMFLASKHAIPAMRDAGGDSVINVSSIAGLRPYGNPA
jgi:NAD(P)-dependent dehydrogenase (short-subunit alcohol dehydrogenase family)